MSDASPLAGGCLCGAIRYRLTGPIIFCGICHCRSCRLSAGAESVGWATVAAGDFALDAGSPAAYASSPAVQRGFCAKCGTTLTFRLEGGDSIDVTLASLDDPESAPVSSEVWLDHRLSWNPANPKLAGYPREGAPAS